IPRLADGCLTHRQPCCWGSSQGEEARHHMDKLVMAKNHDKPESATAPATARKLDLPALESWLWEGACVIRGPLDAPKFKDYILPLIFVKRLSDVFDDEISHLAKDFGDEAKALKLVEQDHGLVRFFIPKKARWASIAEKTTGVGEHLTDA